MFIKLLPDQVTWFWGLIKQAIINAYKIPKDFQQDFTLSMLEKLLTGMSQCWLNYEMDGENRKIHAVCITSILDEKSHGVKTLSIEALYGFRLISMDNMNSMYLKLEKFALSEGCSVLAADYSTSRVKEFLDYLGFEKHRTICRKVISE